VSAGIFLLAMALSLASIFSANQRLKSELDASIFSICQIEISLPWAFLPLKNRFDVDRGPTPLYEDFFADLSEDY